MQTGDKFTLHAQLRGGDFEFTCTCIYDSAQVLRFRLTHKKMEMEVQKLLLTKTRFKWKLMRCNFTFTKQHAGENLHKLFDRLDEQIKNPQSLLEYLNKKKSW
jgi:hypothetical protein